MRNRREYDYVPVTQPIGTFYLCVMKATDLLSSVDVLRRGMSAQERANVQRKLNPRRQVEIANYLSDPVATFPTSIIISAYPDKLEISESLRKLSFAAEDTFGEVIDGQHRLEGIRLALERSSDQDLEGFELPVAVMTGLSSEGKAYVFSVINSKQTQVSSSLIFDLFGLRESRSPMKVCHEIAETFNAREGGPFYRGIKMLGQRYFESEILSQGAFVKYLLELISADPDEDARREKRHQGLEPDPSKPLRELYRERKEAVIGKVLDNYFSAIRDAFPLEWSEDPKRYLLRKTAGYVALLDVFRRDWFDRVSQQQDASLEGYRTLARKLRENSKGLEISSKNFGSSESGARHLANYLLSGASDKG